MQELIARLRAYRTTGTKAAHPSICDEAARALEIERLQRKVEFARFVRVQRYAETLTPAERDKLMEVLLAAGEAPADAE